MFNQKRMTAKLDDTTTFIMERDSSIDDKYHTTCLIDDEDNDNFYIYHGVGDTPDEAIDNLISNMEDEEEKCEEPSLEDCSKEELINIINDQSEYIEDLENENEELIKDFDLLTEEYEKVTSDNLLLQEKIDDLHIDLKQANDNYDTLKNLSSSNFSTIVKKMSDEFAKELTEVLF